MIITKCNLLQVPADYVSGKFSEGKGSFRQKDLMIRYQWMQNIDDTHPTICKILFYVEGGNQVKYPI